MPASYEFLPELCIDKVTFLETEIRTLVLRCDDSSSMGADNIPSFVHRECATILSPAVRQLFLLGYQKLHVTFFMEDIV